MYEHLNRCEYQLYQNNNNLKYFLRTMIQNPQLAQSFVLLSILRDQRDRIQKKLANIPKLQTTISLLSNQLVNRKQQAEQNKLQREAYFQQLIRQYNTRNIQKIEMRKNAEVKLSMLRKNMSQIRILRTQLLKERKQSQANLQQNNYISQSTTEITKRIKTTIQQYKNRLGQKYLHANESQIGNNRVKQIVNYNQELYCQINLINKINKNLQQAALRLSQKIRQRQNEEQCLEHKVYEMRIHLYHQQEELEDKKLKIGRIRNNIQSIDAQSHPLTQQWQQNLSKIEQLERNLQQKLEQNGKISGELKLMSAEGDLKNRDNRLQEHRIECVKMLIKRLYNCRDRLIVHKRNTNSSNTPKSSSNRLGNGSRLTQFSINLSGYREEVLKDINNNI